MAKTSGSTRSSSAKADMSVLKGVYTTNVDNFKDYDDKTKAIAISKSNSELKSLSNEGSKVETLDINYPNGDLVIGSIGINLSPGRIIPDMISVRLSKDQMFSVNYQGESFKTKTLDGIKEQAKYILSVRKGLSGRNESMIAKMEKPMSDYTTNREWSMYSNIFDKIRASHK